MKRGATVALALLVVLHEVNLARVERWLRNKDTEPPPDLTGLWGELVASASRLHRRKLFHEQRVGALLREFRRMAEAIPDGVVLLGPGREIQWFNAAAGRWLGLRRRFDRGIRIDNLVPLIQPADGDSGIYCRAAGHVTMVRDVVFARCAGVVVQAVERL